MYREALRHKQEVTDLYCGNDCENPPELPYNLMIDLKDGVNNREGNPLLINKNPSAIINNYFLNDKFFECEMASGGLFPVLGGINQQPTDFLDYYQVFLKWKEFSRKLEMQRMLGHGKG